MGLQFGLYHGCQRQWHAVVGDAHPVMGALVPGAAAGAAATWLVFPLDTVKKRLQVQGFAAERRPFGHTPRYHSTVHCLATVFRDEGLRGLFKGAWPSLVKAAPSTALSFFVYEHVLSALAAARG